MIVVSQMKQGFARIPSSAIPNYPVQCNLGHCCYNKNGLCDNPRCNRGNSDAACFMIGPKSLLMDHLTKIDE